MNAETQDESNGCSDEAVACMVFDHPLISPPSYMAATAADTSQHRPPNHSPSCYSDHTSSALNIAIVGSALSSCMAESELPPSSSARHYGSRQKSMDRYSSLDSSDTFLSCNTHPFPSQGSLAGLEELAAKGSMAANGSMPAVNISGINSVYVNPFEPPNKNKAGNHHHRHGQRGVGIGSCLQGGTGALSASPKGSPHSRRVKYATRSMSSDTDDTWADALDHEENVFRELRHETEFYGDQDEDEERKRIRVCS